MATTIKVPIGSLSIDNLRYDDSGPADGLCVINRLPEDDETRVKADTNIAFWIVAYSGAITPASIRVWATLDGTRTLLYNGSAGGFQTGFAGASSSITFQKSPGATVNDEALLVIDPESDLVSTDIVTVEIQAQAGTALLNDSYSFTVQSTDPPAVDELLWIDPRRCRARFKNPMQQNTNVGGTLYLVDLTGAIEFIAPDTIRVANVAPNADWEGYWLGLAGSAYPQNQGYFLINEVDAAANIIKIDTAAYRAFKTDDGIDKDADGNVIRRRTLRATITSYRLESRAADELPSIEVAYEPTVTALSIPEDNEYPQGAEIERYVIIDWHDDVSIGRSYKLHAIKAVNDVYAPATLLSAHSFTSPTFGSPADRIKLWDLFPETDRDDDLSHESQLRKMVVVLQDVLNVLWYRCDTIPTLTDPDVAPRAWVDYLLYSMGNPFRFPLTELQKRRLIAVLAGIYTQVGTKKVIEDTLAFFTGITFSCRPFLTADFWSLGAGTLGVTAILGPGSKYARNAYEIVSPVELNDTQRRQVRDVAEFLDPVYMHLVNIIEPGETPGTLYFWTLGESALGLNTQLAP